MQKLKKVIEKLHASRYLTASIDATGSISNTELLVNGVKYSEHILDHWKNTHSLDKEVPASFIYTDGNDCTYDSNNRYNFIYSKQFYEGISSKHNKSENQQYPAILKTIQTAKINTRAVDKSRKHMLPAVARKRVYLVTDMIIQHAQGLSKFFSLQRECKIWWMRFSTDPSKYFLDPYNFKDRPHSTIPSGAQSITIKTKLPHDTLEVESITFLPLIGARFDQGVIQHLSNNVINQSMPAVIRSVIDLDAATGAILFDSADNDRENTLLLNRKLAPYQCAVACYHQDKRVSDLEDLCLHLQFVIQRAGLRFMSEHIIFTQSRDELDIGLQKCDCLGIPYTLIIKESTLRTGLLKLRSRDTTLDETIHISDIPRYLLQIFAN